MAQSLASPPPTTLDEATTIVRSGSAEARWHRGLARLSAYSGAHGTAAVPGTATEQGFALGRWVAKQREQYRAGRLSPAQIEALAALPGWHWSGRREDLWMAGLARLHSYADQHGSAAVEATLVWDGYQLGAWVGRRRNEYRAGTLAPDHVAALEALPGWVWTLREDTWASGLVALHSYLDQYGTARVPSFAVHQGYPLGRWVRTRRVRYRRGSLPAERAATLQALPGWAWNARETHWQQGLRLLTAYAERTGRPNPPASYVEPAEVDFPLGSWVRSRRKEHRRGELSAERTAALEALAGWEWDPYEASWQRKYSLAQRHATEHGGVAGLGHREVIDGVKVGQWVKAQRNRQRAGRLAPSRIAALEALPGWSWTGTSVRAENADATR